LTAPFETTTDGQITINTVVHRVGW